MRERALPQTSGRSEARPLEDRRAIFVIGMHRSGTSALTRVLNLLCADVGRRLMSPHPEHPTGFWEHLDLVTLNDRVLRGLGSKWDAVWDLPPRWQESEQFDSSRRDFAACSTARIEAQSL